MSPKKRATGKTASAPLPHLSHPRQVMDLLNYQFFVILGFGSAPIVQVCERKFGITRHEWGFVGLLAALGPVAPSDLALHAGMDRSRTSKEIGRAHV